MGMDLCGSKGRYFHWTNLGWRQVRERAEAAGWQPTGTGAPRGVRNADWHGGYFSNDGQRVYVRDARALAEALETTLDAVPPELVQANREFIVFCRAGTFRLY